MPTTTSFNTLFGYGRVSTAEQTTDNQRQELKEAGYAIPSNRWFTDTISGKVQAMKRPQFARLVDKLREGDILVVSKLDRLGRDTVDVVSTVERLQGMGVRVVVHALGGTDLTSSAGKVMVTVLAAVATMERDLLVERTQAGLARAKAEGKQLGRPFAASEEARAKARQLKEEGVAVAEIARRLGVSRASVRAYAQAGEDA